MGPNEVHGIWHETDTNTFGNWSTRLNHMGPNEILKFGTKPNDILKLVCQAKPNETKFKTSLPLLLTSLHS